MIVNYILGWLFVTFGVVMSILCLYHGIRKLLNGETDFRGLRLIKKLNAFQGSEKDFSGTEILTIGLCLIASTLLLYYLIFIK